MNIHICKTRSSSQALAEMQEETQQGSPRAKCMPAIQSNPAFPKGTRGTGTQNNSHLWSYIQQELRHAVIFFPEGKR